MILDPITKHTLTDNRMITHDNCQLVSCGHTFRVHKTKPNKKGIFCVTCDSKKLNNEETNNDIE